MSGKMTETLVRLLVRQAVAFELFGMHEDCGFAVRVTNDVAESGEGEWVILRYEGSWAGKDRERVKILAEREAQHGEGYAQGWAKWPLADVVLVLHGADRHYDRMGFEDLEDAVLLALRIGDGELAYEEI